MKKKSTPRRSKANSPFARIMAAILYSESVQHSKSARLADEIALANLKDSKRRSTKCRTTRR